MKNKAIMIFMVIAIILSLLNVEAKAEEKMDLEGQCRICRSDFQEHAVTSFALTYTSYMVYRKKLELSPEAALFSSIATGLLLSYARDKYIFRKSEADVGEYMKASAAGAAVSAVFTIVIPF